MAVRITMRFTVAAVIIGMFLMPGIAICPAQIAPPLSLFEFKATVFDESGAVIPNCEIVLTKDSETIVSHTGPEGSVTVLLPSGTYALTTSKAGFITHKMSQVQIDRSMSEALRIVLKVDSTPTDGGVFDGVPVTTSELPTVIQAEPDRAPSASERALTVCDLQANVKKFVGQTITLNATVAANEEFWAFTYDSCEPPPIAIGGKHPLIAPHFNEGYNFKSSVSKKLNKILRKEHQARVTIVGVLVDPGGYFGHQLCCRYRFDVVYLVSAEHVAIAK